MSIPKITGREARELLDGDLAPLFVRAPELATTVAWLYEREAGDVRYGYEDDITGESSGLVYIEVDDGYRTADEAVDLARALLAAAEEARNATA